MVFNKKLSIYVLISFILGVFLGRGMARCPVKESFSEKNSTEQNKTVSSDKPLPSEVSDNDKKGQKILPLPTKEYKGEVAIIIDDFGYNKKIAEEFIDLDISLDISILPNLPYSTVIAEMAKKGGKEVMLHLPLEPYGYPKVNPGPGVILVNMEEEEVLRQLEENLQSVPYAVGADNHEGSKATEDKRLMTTILEQFKKKGLFFIDARTSSKSVAYNVAKQLKMSVGKNAVFLDNERSVDYIKQRLYLLAKLAQQKGKAIAIGHPHQKTLTALRESLVLFRKEKIKVTFVSNLLQKRNSARTIEQEKN